MRKGVIVWMAMAAILTAGAAWGAGTNTLTVQATVAGTCKFSSGTATLNFGTLDPAVGTNVDAPDTPVQFWCTKGVTNDLITANNGLNPGSGKRQMSNATSGDLIPYTLSLDPGTGTNAGPGSPRTLTLKGTVLGSDYTAVSAGTYSDTVTLSINP